MELMDAIRNRRSVRKYSHRPVSDDVVKQLLEAATWAPSASNSQDWRFIVIQDESTLKKLVQLGTSSFIAGAPMAVLVLYRNTTVNLEYRDFIQSASAAIQNLLLRAHELGLGTCWVNQLPRRSELRHFFNIPSHYDPVALISLGYYDYTPRPVPRRVPVERGRLYTYDRYEFQEPSATRVDPKLFAKRILAWLFFRCPRFIRKMASGKVRKYEGGFDN